MTQQQYCWEQDCGFYGETPDVFVPSASPLAPVLFFFFIISTIIWAFQPKKVDKPKSPEEKLFEAIGKFEADRAKTGKKTRFNYVVKDPCAEECKSDK
jgi:hypothetical protein